MIIVRGEVVNKDEANVIIKKTENGFILTHTHNGEVFEFDKAKLEFFPDIAYLTKDVWGKSVMFWQSEIGHSRDGYSSICLRKKINMMQMQMAYAMVAVDDFGQAHLLVYGNAYIDGAADSITVDSSARETGCDIFERLIPSIDKFMKHSRAKVEALARFNAVDAISGLENQIDLLTSAVAVLMAEFPVEKRPAWWDSFVSVVETHSSNKLRGDEKAISNIEIEKSKAREVQNAFFAKLTNG